MVVQCRTIQHRHFPRSSLAQAIHERPLTATGQITVGTVVDKLALRRGFLPILPTSRVGIIPLKHHVPISFIYHPFYTLLVTEVDKKKIRSPLTHTHTHTQFLRIENAYRSTFWHTAQH